METHKSPDTPNRRTGRRRVLRQPATLTVLPGKGSRPVTVWDLGLDGMSVLSPKPVAPGSRCELQFELVQGSRSTPVQVSGKTVYSSFVGDQGFRIGLVFTQLADATAAQIEQFANAGP
jgi:hypothetical protein